MTNVSVSVESGVLVCSALTCSEEDLAIEEHLEIEDDSPEVSESKDKEDNLKKCKGNVGAAKEKFNAEKCLWTIQTKADGQEIKLTSDKTTWKRTTVKRSSKDLGYVARQLILQVGRPL